jgi:hypothetical protein
MSDKVICPHCAHDFRAIPEDVQAELAALKAEPAQPEPVGFVKVPTDELQDCISMMRSNTGSNLYWVEQFEAWLEQSGEGKQ